MLFLWALATHTDYSTASNPKLANGNFDHAQLGSQVRIHDIRLFSAAVAVNNSAFGAVRHIQAQ